MLESKSSASGRKKTNFESNSDVPISLVFFSEFKVMMLRYHIKFTQMKIFKQFCKVDRTFIYQSEYTYEGHFPGSVNIPISNISVKQSR